MKKIILLIAVLACTSSLTAQKIEWLTLNEALALQKETPKKIIMDVYTVWCGPCKLLDKKTFGNKDVAAYINNNFYPVKFNGEGNDSINYKERSFGNPMYDKTKATRRNSSHEFANFMGINAYPTIVFLGEKGEFIMPLKGYYKPSQLEIYLKMFATNKHKEFTSKESFDTYFNAFQPKFVD
jgi:thioredoxin-related protein